ncbi:hypothetical protein DS901_12645 [Loktanella sp. D2R18]|uniref:NosD domain-containing protein n=1 Tax=Rhodobacterales TaxID=204455 RepID=UPI000DE9DFC2|nr:MULTISPECIES: right-handed parallel beta-helix repeat-containing protein [Rhodobacterales]MDO6591922.1 NosD domain-containing protein [Yoonia sp. 1_MG-2023]RBW42646.1 hypothetical protein DS901_12645 [Loktanella sp. D2R18]
MPKQKVPFIWGLTLTALFCGVGASVSHAQTIAGYAELGENIATTYDDFQQKVDHIRRPSDLAQDMRQDGLVAPTTELQMDLRLPTMSLGQLELVDMRFALMQLSFSIGSNDQLIVMRAQNADQPRVIAVQHGALTLAQLRDWVATQPEPETLMTDDTLRIPLVVFQNARFVVQPGDTLRLSRADGAFIANLGTLVIEGAEISGTEVPNPRSSNFAPFVTTVGTGMARISDALFENLGFGETSGYSGVSVINRGLYTPIGDSYLVQSVLRDITRVTFDSTNAAVLKGNVFAGEKAGTVELRQTTQSRVIENIFMDSQNGSALRVTEGSTSTTLNRNLVLNSTSNGVTISNDSKNTIVLNNIVWGSEGGGISVNDSDCVYLANNVVIDNRRKGIELRTSQRSVVTENYIFGNRSAGLFIGDQPIGSPTRILDNVFVGNRIGLSSASAHRLTLRRNNFLNQFPRFLDGDLASQSHKIVADLQGDQDIDLVTGGIQSFAIAPETCTYELDS